MGFASRESRARGEVAQRRESPPSRKGLLRRGGCFVQDRHRIGARDGRPGQLHTLTERGQRGGALHSAGRAEAKLRARRSTHAARVRALGVRRLLAAAGHATRAVRVRRASLRAERDSRRGLLPALPGAAVLFAAEASGAAMTERAVGQLACISSEQRPGRVDARDADRSRLALGSSGRTAIERGGRVASRGSVRGCPGVGRRCAVRCAPGVGRDDSCVRGPGITGRRIGAARGAAECPEHERDAGRSTQTGAEKHVSD